MRPIPDLRDQAMLDRIDVNVIDVTGEVALVSNGVLPIAPLPDATFALGGAAIGNSFADGQAA
jgi:hypothetical protein